MASTRVLPIGFCSVEFRHLPNYTSKEQTCSIAFDIAAPPFTQGNAEEITDVYEGVWGSMGSAGIVFTGIRVTVAVDAFEPLIFETSRAGAPSDASTLLPPNCAILIDKNTNRAGRRNRGRMFVPGAGEDETEASGALTAPSLVRWTEYADGVFGLADGPTTNLGDAVILHSYVWTGDVDPGPPVGFPVPTVITSLTVDPMIGTQRRRMR